MEVKEGVKYLGLIGSRVLTADEHHIAVKTEQGLVLMVYYDKRVESLIVRER